MLRRPLRLSSGGGCRANAKTQEWLGQSVMIRGATEHTGGHLRLGRGWCSSLRENIATENFKKCEVRLWAEFMFKIPHFLGMVTHTVFPVLGRLQAEEGSQVQGHSGLLLQAPSQVNRKDVLYFLFGKQMFVSCTGCHSLGTIHLLSLRQGLLTVLELG